MYLQIMPDYGIAIFCRPDKAFTPHLAFRTQNRLIAARRPALQLVTQIRRRAFNGQGIGCRIPEDAFT
ncbi:hypothetical protein BU54_01855 [Escherichia coli O45:H2 str. 2010C-4211]|nr:hypothetical protein BW72_01040 [Escherichia coli O78:H12 str. 00-3279]KDV31130.1 hypothetical protein BU55_27890 [Escherichia coli O146:H21 str. 2010C-3325]KDV43937.1 hypothetical protein BU53_00810 [Escherichia coli O91:H21 str. 2009C-3740]KDV57198.1 hypothetical protein BU54_01855 [Escherichia coli O45:H2 str. 2010C-4211]KDV64516.1 hypothetical protein BU64_22425 [Escherichia coli O128:H2 str. 2011C-3317]